MITRETLSSKTGPQLVEFFNTLASREGKPTVVRFSSREDGIRRILSMVPPPEKVVQAPVGDDLNWLGPDIKARLTKRVWRPSGKGRLIAELRQGRTPAQLRALFPQWDDSRLRRHVRALGWWIGFGVRQDRETGTITLVD